MMLKLEQALHQRRYNGRETPVANIGNQDSGTVLTTEPWQIV